MKKLRTIITVMLCLTLFCCESAFSESYSATMSGFGGDVTVQITVDNQCITQCEILAEYETPAIGGAAAESLSKAIVEANGKVEGISGATVTSNAVMAALQSAMEQANLTDAIEVKMKPGTYTGSAIGFSAQSRIIVHVTVDEDKILSMEIEPNCTAVHPDTYTDCPHMA